MCGVMVMGCWGGGGESGLAGGCTCDGCAVMGTRKAEKEAQDGSVGREAGLG